MQFARGPVFHTLDIFGVSAACGPTLASPPSSWGVAVAELLQLLSFGWRSVDDKWKLGTTTNWKARTFDLQKFGNISRRRIFDADLFERSLRVDDGNLW